MDFRSGMARLVERVSSTIVARNWSVGSADYRKRITGTVIRGFERTTYERLRENGLKPDAIIDVGANRGDWSRMTRQIFPDAEILMIEAQSQLKPELAQTARDIGKAYDRIALLGPIAGDEHTFFEMGTGSSLLAENSNAERVVSKAVATTLDALAGEVLPNAQAMFMKLDIQGAELMVLRGGEDTLARCAAVQLEVALLSYNAGAPLLCEVVTFMAERGLLVTEVAGFSRPGPHLVQIDLVFARHGCSLRPDFFIF